MFDFRNFKLSDFLGTKKIITFKQEVSEMENKLEEVVLKRFKYDDKQVLGTLHYKGKEVAKTLELAWNNNNPRASCIPKGNYKVIRRKSAKYGNHFHILDVPRRSYILIHHANYYWNLLGCVAVGKAHIDINNDGYLDVTSSKPTMTKLLKELPLEFNLKIEGKH